MTLPLAVLSCSLAIAAQQPAPLASAADRQKGQGMLRLVKDDLKKNYYDPAFHGMDIEARFATASARIETAQSIGQILGIIGQAVVDLDDSHTRFEPPDKVNRVDYGWVPMMVGDQCLVAAVRPGSDAEAKGLEVGDEVVLLQGANPSRANMWKMKYLFYSLRPVTALTLTVRRSGGADRDLTIAARIRPGKQLIDLTSGDDIWDLIRGAEDEDRVNRHRTSEIGKEIFVWKMPAFDLDDAEVDRMMGRARPFPTLILDMRGNPGGAVRTLERLIGLLFDHDVKVADLKGRKKLEPIVGKTRGRLAYGGKVVALIDSESSSAAEFLARVLQIEKRGTVIGDRSAGAVMMSRYYGRQVGVDTATLFGTSITEADVIMADGKSLEKVGVTPDEVLLPTGSDLLASRDTVMSRATEILGARVDPSAAGRWFPVEWVR